MAEAGKGGGELIGGATVQIAFNFGNAVGSMVGGGVLDASHMNYHYPALSGVPFAALAVLLLVLYSVRYERRGRDENPLRAERVCCCVCTGFVMCAVICGQIAKPRACDHSLAASARASLALRAMPM